MANSSIDYADYNYATGNKIIMQLMSRYFVKAARNRGAPFRKITNVSAAIAAMGDTARVPVTATTSSSLLTDGSNRTLDDTTPATVDVTLSQNRCISYAETDVAELLSGGAVAESLFEGRVAGILNDTEADLLTLFVTGSTTNIVGSYTGGAFTEANVCTLVADLLNQKPPQEPFHAFISATSWTALSQIANFNASYVRGYLPGEAAPSLSTDYGENGRPWHNTYFHLCQAVNAAGGNTTNVFLSPGAVAFAMRPLDSASFFGSDGYISVPFADAASGVAGSIVRAKNFLNFSKEISLRLLYGMAVVKEPWTGLYKN